MKAFSIAAAIIGMIASGNIAIAASAIIAPAATDSIAIGIESKPAISGIITIQRIDIR